MGEKVGDSVTSNNGDFITGDGTKEGIGETFNGVP